MVNQAAEGLFSPFLQWRRIHAALPYISGRVLDVGCGNGALAAFVPPENYYGVDRASAAVAVASRRFPKHIFSLNMPTSDQFNTIAALAVIEHLKDPIRILREWKTHLAAGGSLVLTTPHKSFGWCHDAGAAVGLFSAHAAEEHEILFTYTSLLQIVREIGMEIAHYQRFLCGVNQLCVIECRA